MTPCPMCQATEHRPGSRVYWREIWDALEAEFGVDLRPEFRAAYQVGDWTALGPCGSCGLLYFSPAVAGGPDFYELLGSGTRGYYDPIKWEARAVSARIAPEEDVVDFGSGDGRLLRSLAPNRPGRAVGVDHNPSAISSLAAQGIEGSTEDFETFAERESGNFDVACAMQVLEHVADVAPLIRSCVRSLRPGGRLFVAVPNHERTRDPGPDPLDHPPHHMSRWTAVDFETLADRFGLQVVDVLQEPGERQAFRRAMERRIPGDRAAWFLSRAIARVTPPRLASASLGRMAPGASTSGHSLLVELRRIDE